MQLKLLFFIFVFLAVQGGAATYHVAKSGPPEYFNDIQSAVDVATNAGDVVLIHDGTYVLSNAVTVSSAVVLQSLSGPAETIIDGDGLSPCFELADVNCVLSGLTIQNGYNDSGAGGVICGNNHNPIITNCVITHCSGDYGGGITGGTVIQCEISYNGAQYSGGGAAFSHIHNSLIASNTASNDYAGGAYQCILRNCTVVDNEAGSIGGGVDDCDIYNSIIFGNTAPSFPDLDPSYNPTLVYSCSPDINHGSDGNITNAPVFVDAGLGDFRLSSVSSCINAGHNGHVTYLLDLDASSRIVGETVDMGAYEFQVTESDQDGDALPDDWEIRYFGGIHAVPDGHGDADQFSNLQEYIAGTDPTNSASYFAITNYTSGSFILEWPTAEGREYRVYWAASLTNHFSQQGDPIDAPVNSYTDTTHTAEETGFYKVDVRLP